MIYKRTLLMLFLALILAACDGLGGEPEVVATIPQPTPVVTNDTGYPVQAPDLANGAMIFSQRCTDCHGINGEGDGELVATGEVPRMPSFLTASVTRQQTPREWFMTITNGRLENLMPPWGGSLSEEERWDVAYYTYTLHYTPEQLEDGEQIYAQECAGCHGENGEGNGPDLLPGEEAPSLVDFQNSIQLSDENMYTIIAEGASVQMPAFAEDLTEEQIWSVVSHVRSLSLDAVGTVEQQSTTSAQSTEGTPLPIIGQITHANDEPIPEDLTVRLRVFDAQTFEPYDELEQETTVEDDFSYEFTDVPVVDGRLYLVVANVNGRDFASNIIQGDETAEFIELPVEIYTLTNAPEDLLINALVMQVYAVGDGLEVQQVMQVTNLSDAVFSAIERDDNGIYRSIEIPLPDGAVLIGFDQNAAYGYSDTENVAYDTRPLLPDEQRFVMVNYLLPYEDGATIDLPFRYAIGGQVRVLVSPYDTMEVTAELLPSDAEETIGDTIFQSYGQQLALAPADSPLSFVVTGEPAQVVADNDNTGTDTRVPVQENRLSNEDLIIAVVVGVAFLAVILGVLIRARRSGNEDGQIEQLVRQIASLDRQHDAGQINHDVYQRQRAELKAQLAELMKAKDE